MHPAIAFPFLHPLDAPTHAPWWVLALCLAGGVGLGIMLTSGGTVVRWVRGAPGKTYRIERWGVREGSFWAEVAGAPDVTVSWTLHTRAGRPCPLAIEPMPGDRFGLVGTLPGDDPPAAVEWRRPGAGGPARIELGPPG